jgi:hypothetical protein
VAQTGTNTRAKAGQGATWAQRQGSGVVRCIRARGLARRELFRGDTWGEMSEEFFSLFLQNDQ